LENVGETAGPLRNELISRIGNESFCPGVDLEAQTGVDFDTIINDAVTFLDSLGNFSEVDVSETRDVVEQAQSTNDNVQETSDNITPSDWQSLIFIVPFTVFSVLFCLGVALAWCGRAINWYTCFLKWVVMPLFIILIVICFLCAGAIAIGASANADFCSGGAEMTPEGTIQDILAINGFSEEDLAYRVINFYIEVSTNTVVSLMVPFSQVS